MESSQQQPNPSNSASNGTGTSALRNDFVETLEHRRFAEFCEATRRYAYIGLCYGTPGVGKTLSARHFCRAELAETYDLARRGPFYDIPLDTAFYTATVVNSPASVTHGISTVRDRLTSLARSPLRSQARIALDTLKLRTQNYHRARGQGIGTAAADRLSAPPDFLQSTLEWEAKARAVGDPTTLIVIDEADRL